MTLDDYIVKMVPNHKIDSDGLIDCDFSELTQITKEYIKKVTGRDAEVYFNYETIEICFGTREQLFVDWDKVHTITYENMFLV
jgi:hypothetical protein